MIGGITKIPADSELGMALLNALSNPANGDPAKKDYGIEARVLIDAFQDITRANPFRIGALVTPNSFGLTRYTFSKDEPLLVVDTYLPRNADADKSGNSCDRNDMDIVVRRGGDMIRFPVESWRFTHYTGPIEPVPDA